MKLKQFGTLFFHSHVISTHSGAFAPVRGAGEIYVQSLVTVTEFDRV